DVFAAFRDHLKSRLHLVPFFERKLVLMPIQLDHPIWVHDDNLDLDYHFRHVSLPKPGTLEQLETLVARLHMILLDRTRPLWQYYVIEGLEGGGFAAYIIMHHAGIDGAAGVAAPAFRLSSYTEHEPALALTSATPPPSRTRRPSVAVAQGQQNTRDFRADQRLLRKVFHPAARVLRVVARPRQGDRESGTARYGGPGEPASHTAACTENAFQCVAVQPAIIRNLHHLSSRRKGCGEADKVKGERHRYDDQRGRTAALPGDSERPSRWPPARSGAGLAK